MLLLITPCKMKNDLFCPLFHFFFWLCVCWHYCVFSLVCHKMTFYIYIYIYIKRIYHSIYSIKLNIFFILKDQTGFLACVKFLNISCVYKLTVCQSPQLCQHLIWCHFGLKPHLLNIPSLFPLIYFSVSSNTPVNVWMLISHTCTHTAVFCFVFCFWVFFASRAQTLMLNPWGYS